MKATDQFLDAYHKEAQGNPSPIIGARLPAHLLDSLTQECLDCMTDEQKKGMPQPPKIMYFMGVRVYIGESQDEIVFDH